MTAQQIRTAILASFPDAELNVKDLTGTGDHWHVAIVSQRFNNQSILNQHKLVYDALAAYMKKEIHALSIDTKPRL